jgi:hypothetical protein
MAPLGPHGMFFLAAAVSDFYIPDMQLASHKIQSGGGGVLHLELEPVPKCLPLLRSQWAPSCFCVSFKLETNETILMEKARGALERNGVHMVIANELHSRYRKVQLVTESGVSTITHGTHEEGDIEQKLVEDVALSHFMFIAEGSEPQGSIFLPLPTCRQKRRLWRRASVRALQWAVIPASALISWWLQRWILGSLRGSSQSRVEVTTPTSR